MPLEKTEENLNTCQICKRKFNNKRNNNVHIALIHKLSSKDYYNLFFKNESEGICKSCGNPTNYDNKRYMYSMHCSTKCSSNDKSVREKVEQTNLKLYGTIAPSMNNIIKEKAKATNIKKYGCEWVQQNTIIKNKTKLTNIKKYGYEIPTKNNRIKEKIQQTNLKKYGTICTLNTNISIQKKKKTWLKRYGVENPTQNIDILEKAQKTAKQSKPYILPSSKIIHKQGYEPQFLDYIFQNNILKEDEIDYHPKGIRYIAIDNKSRIYFPDFYIPKWNLIIEIKSSWIMIKDVNVYLKELGAKLSGYKYFRIIDNNFLYLNDFLKTL